MACYSKAKSSWMGSHPPSLLYHGTVYQLSGGPKIDDANAQFCLYLLNALMRCNNFWHK